MILPTKHLPLERSLLAIGADILRSLDEPKTVSRLWDETKQRRTGSWRGSAELTFDWYLLALDLLFALGAVDLERGQMRRLPQ